MPWVNCSLSVHIKAVAGASCFVRTTVKKFSHISCSTMSFDDDHCHHCYTFWHMRGVMVARWFPKQVKAIALAAFLSGTKLCICRQSCSSVSSSVSNSIIDAVHMAVHMQHKKVPAHTQYSAVFDSMTFCFFAAKIHKK